MVTRAIRITTDTPQYTVAPHLDDLLDVSGFEFEGVYILKFECAFGGDKHKIQFYGGYSKNVRGRLWYHSVGQGSSVTRYARRNGIKWAVVYAAPGTPQDEKRMKRQSYAEFLAARGITV